MGKMIGCFTSGCGNQMKLISMLGLTGSFMVVELVVGNTTNSMALVADSFHMLSDVIAIIIAFVSVRMSPKRWKKNTYGWARAEVVGALVNSVFLIALCFSILVEAIKRFMVIEPLKDPKLILIVGGVGLGINLVGLLIFGHHGHSHEGTAGHSHGEDDHDHAHAHLHSADKLTMEENKNKKTEKGEDVKNKQKEMSGEQMNIAGVFLHILADALGSVVVIISALVIWLTDWQYKDYLDPVLSVVIVILICISSWPLLRDSTLVLLNSIPAHIDLDKIEQELLRRTQVTSVHELHVWRLVGSRVVASCHLEVARPGPETSALDNYNSMAKEIKELFHSYGIHSTTIQLEYVDDGYFGCQVPCPAPAPGVELAESDSCIDSSCCRNRFSSEDNPAIDVKTQF